jgi:hypothetical protein
MTETQPQHNYHHKTHKNRQSTFFETFSSSLNDKN